MAVAARHLARRDARRPYRPHPPPGAAAEWEPYRDASYLYRGALLQAASETAGRTALTRPATCPSAS